MRDKYTNKKILYGGLAILIIFIVLGIVLTNSRQTDKKEYNFPSPKDVVRQYFETWSNKDWPNMYAGFSDGFKRIEPTARTLNDFRDYAVSQNINEVNIIEIKETSNDGQTASIDYNVEFTSKNGQQMPFNGTFTLKFRTADIIQGWKLIHPYGDNIDSS